MNIRVLFFGATADEAGTRVLELTLDENAIARDAFEQVLNQFPSLSTHRLLFALNQEYVSKDACLNDGDEIAIFTAVSGG
jgi:molybdopterin converting factor small subunit